MSIQALEFSLSADERAMLTREAKKAADRKKREEEREEAEAKERDRVRKTEAQEILLDSIIAGNPIFQDNLDNIPEFVVTDERSLDAEIAELLLPLSDGPEENLYHSFDLWVDTAGNIQKVVIPKINGQQIRTLLTKHFRITEPGYVTLGDKEVKVLSRIRVKVNISKRKAITAQEVILIKKEDKTYDFSFQKNHSASSVWRYDIFDGSDSSYIPVLREYMQKQDISKIKSYNKATLYVRHDQSTVELVFGRGKKYTKPTMKIGMSPLIIFRGIGIAAKILAGSIVKPISQMLLSN